jgi:tripartite-type tricarboxylate transporter receptor subunit TctC
MDFLRREFLGLMLGAVSLPTLHRSARAQSYPTRPITIIVGYPAGGPTDALARIMADGMRAAVGQTLIVENIGGAAGSIAAERVAHAVPDGYTLNFGNFGDHVVAGAVYPLHYDVLSDFEPIALVSSHPLLIVARSNLPANNLQEFIGWLRSNPDKASEGTLGPGSIQHVAGIFLQKLTGTRFQFVPYRGSAPAMQDLLSGQIDFLIDPAPNSLPQVRAGTVKALAVTARNRLPAAPDIPTTDEAGIPGFYAGSWHAFWAPKGTSRAVVDTLNAAVVAAVAEPSVRQRLMDLGQQIFPSNLQTPEALRAFQTAEIEKWWPIIKAAGIKAD